MININLGDWSDDGHGKTSDNFFDCTHTRKQIITAYKKGCEKLGFVLHDTVAEAYDDSSISEEIYDKFKTLGFTGIIEDTEYLQTEDLVDLFIFTIQLGNPTIVFTPAVNEVQEMFGYEGLSGNFGYGLFN
jgi:hypothetical protein